MEEKGKYYSEVNNSLERRINEKYGRLRTLSSYIEQEPLLKPSPFREFPNDAVEIKNEKLGISVIRFKQGENEITILKDNLTRSEVIVSSSGGYDNVSYIQTILSPGLTILEYPNEKRRTIHSLYMIAYLRQLGYNIWEIEEPFLSSSVDTKISYSGATTSMPRPPHLYFSSGAKIEKNTTKGVTTISYPVCIPYYIPGKDLQNLDLSELEDSDEDLLKIEKTMVGVEIPNKNSTAPLTAKLPFNRDVVIDPSKSLCTISDEEIGFAVNYPLASQN